MDAQEIFNKVSAHLLKQNKQSLCEDGEECAYRGENGLTCAVGCLIPDSAYDPIIEGCGVDDARVKDTLMGLGLIGSVVCDQDTRLRLLAALQDVHDSTPILQWPANLRIVAATFNLTVSDAL